MAAKFELTDETRAVIDVQSEPCRVEVTSTLVLLVTNPVDVITFAAQELTGLPPDRVIGSGTVLDTSRLRHLLAERLGVGVGSVHATIVGEHGDSEIALWSTASVGGTALLNVIGPTGGRIRADELDGLLHEVRTAAYTIIEGKGATNLAIGLATVRIMRSIATDERAVLPVSVRIDIADVGPVCMSLPSVVGRAGVMGRLEPALDDAERTGLRASALAIREAIDVVQAV
jgi:L-lactate dehydrogenase